MNPNPKRILLLEDEEPIARVTKRMLERNGYSVTYVLDGSEGLEAATSGEYDLCLLNVLLPGLGGYSIAEKIHADGVHLPLIFFTAKSGQEVKAKIDGMGIKAAHMQKPPSIRALIEKIEEVLDGRGWL
jgi:DNA-binding response OmpR family regulator